MKTETTTIPIWTTTIGITSVGLNESAHRAAIDQAADVIGTWDALFNRFHAASMLSQLNRMSGQWVSGGESFSRLFDAARDGVFATAGRFDPAILPALEAAGYDRSLDIRGVRRMGPVPGTIICGPAAWQDVDIDRHRHRVRLPPGMRVDLGGIAKGALADALADRFAHWPGGAVSVGGDLRLWGIAPDEGYWQVGIEDPLEPDLDIATVTIDKPQWRALATSTPRKRKWQTPGGTAHHLIDPRTLRPAVTAFDSVTCCASTGIDAEIAATSLLLGAEALPAGCLWAVAVPGEQNISQPGNEASRCVAFLSSHQALSTHPSPPLASHCSFRFQPPYSSSWQ